MKVKFQYAKGKAVVSYHADVTLEEALDILRDPDVITLTVTKKTAAQYLKEVGPVNEAPKRI